MTDDRKPMVAGNWKMNLSRKEAIALVEGLARGIRDCPDVDILVAPPFTHLDVVRSAIGDAKIFLAGQNMHFEMRGAFTGEISGRMLQEASCTHVILGHSERRQLFQETSDMINLKVKAAAVLGLIPIVCIGETIDQRQAGQTSQVIQDQLEKSLDNYLKDERMFPGTILAYEPVWAIGTGHTATPEQAQEVHGFIRQWIRTTFNDAAARQVRILYGGSVNPENIRGLMSQPDIDGALVGGASLKLDSFLSMAHFQG